MTTTHQLIHRPLQHHDSDSLRAGKLWRLPLDLPARFRAQQEVQQQLGTHHDGGFTAEHSIPVPWEPSFFLQKIVACELSTCAPKPAAQ